ncbi:hypothetical protein CHLRE_10g446050v5 [Chlamydomonas reinhardtii]|uniref:Glycosyltransferase family 92 protein n=1 Tax=Chlamydomonas reinhardtii TaxID=3055 RepID=A0A2K3DAV0_CHLRE|nr:uncharacterized protein CHLRE_10g446050v5 [Chlamydomonas reinhardtii]PNW77659.1 hypothetical protein CHLRE_10g446050v5 [Chlamydomonas reinhardtii]
MPNRSLRIWGNLLLSAVLLSVYATSADVAHTGTDQSAQATQVSSSVYRGFAALCAVAKNENRYVREWVDHHKCLGFSRIYLYDHGSQERMSSQLEDHIASGFVSYTYFTGHHKKYSRDARPTSLEKFLLTAQGYAYKKCVKHHSKSHSFLGFIDIDEFLVLMDPGIVSVEQLLRPYSGFGGLAVHWQLVGSSNHTARPAGPVTTSYTHCVKPEAMENRQFKVFANTAARPVMQNPHRPRLFAPQNVPFPYLVNEHRKRIRSC